MRTRVPNFAKTSRRRSAADEYTTHNAVRDIIIDGCKQQRSGRWGRKSGISTKKLISCSRGKLGRRTTTTPPPPPYTRIIISAGNPKRERIYYLRGGGRRARGQSAFRASFEPFERARDFFICTHRFPASCYKKNTVRVCSTTFSPFSRARLFPLKTSIFIFFFSPSLFLVCKTIYTRARARSHSATTFTLYSFFFFFYSF